jgi:hypothetical protein
MPVITLGERSALQNAVLTAAAPVADERQPNRKIVAEPAADIRGGQSTRDGETELGEAPRIAETPKAAEPGIAEAAGSNAESGSAGKPVGAAVVEVARGEPESAQNTAIAAAINAAALVPAKPATVASPIELIVEGKLTARERNAIEVGARNTLASLATANLSGKWTLRMALAAATGGSGGDKASAQFQLEMQRPDGAVIGRSRFAPRAQGPVSPQKLQREASQAIEANRAAIEEWIANPVALAVRPGQKVR